MRLRRGRFKCRAVTSQPSPAQDVAGPDGSSGLKKAMRLHLWNKKVGGCEKIHRLGKMRASVGA